MSEENNIDPIAQFILDGLANVDNNEPITHEKIAKGYWHFHKKKNDKPDAWRKYINTVKQQAIFLARTGKIELTRRGKPVDPNNFKGLVRLRLKK